MFVRRNALEKRLAYLFQGGICVEVDELPGESLGSKQRVARLRCQHRRHLLRALHQLFSRINMIDQSYSKGFIGGDVLPGQRQLFRARKPDRLVQRVNDLSEPDVDLRLTED